MSLRHHDDPKWVEGPTYSRMILLAKEDNAPYWNGQYRVGAQWYFEKSPQYEWLMENFGPTVFCYTYGDEELEDETMPVYIGFTDEKVAKAFEEKFETCNWNIEGPLGYLISPKSNEVIHYFTCALDYPYYKCPEKHNLEVYEKVQWCRENITKHWSYKFDNDSLMAFYFLDEDDAMAFKMAWL